MKPRKRKATAKPPGVPQKVWDEEMKRQEEYIAEWSAEVTKHIRDYDRMVAAKKAKKPKKGVKRNVG